LVNIWFLDSFAMEYAPGGEADFFQRDRRATGTGYVNKSNPDNEILTSAHSSLWKENSVQASRPGVVVGGIPPAC
jgi:hypothetical protein